MINNNVYLYKFNNMQLIDKCRGYSLNATFIQTL